MQSDGRKPGNAAESGHKPAVRKKKQCSTWNKKEVIKMKKEMMKLLKSYIEKYNSLRADLYLDEMLGVDVKYDKGKIYELSDVVYDMAAILDIELNMDIKGYIKIAE